MVRKCEMRVRLPCPVLAVVMFAGAVSAATLVQVGVENPIKDLSSQPCGFGLGFNGDLAHEVHTQAKYFFVEHSEKTAACFREAGVRLVRAGYAVPFWQGDRANRMRFYDIWKDFDFGRAALDMSKPWPWAEPKAIYDFFRTNGQTFLPILSTRVYDAEKDAMSGSFECVKKATLDYLAWLRANGYADMILGFELDNEPYFEISDPRVYADTWKRLLPEIAQAWPGVKIGLPVAIYVKGDPDLAEVRRRLTGNDLLSSPNREDRLNQWTGNAIVALGDSARFVTHLCIHVYGAGEVWNCNSAGIQRTNRLRAAFPLLKDTRTWITEWRDQSDNDSLSQRRFRTLLWKADYILMALSRPEVDAIFQHFLYGQSGAIYWSTGKDWYFQPERQGSRKMLADTTGDGKPRMVRGACGALYKMLFDALADRTALVGFGAARGLESGAIYYDSIVRHDRALAVDPSRDLPFEGDLMWIVATDAARQEGTFVAVNTHAHPEDVTLVVSNRCVGTAVCRTLTCRPEALDRFEIPGETPPWRVDSWSEGQRLAGARTFTVPPFAVFTARFPLDPEKD